MKLAILATTVFLGFTSLSGCTFVKTTYATDYDRDYIYSVRRVLDPPNWNDTTYPGYTWGSYPWYGSNWGM